MRPHYFDFDRYLPRGPYDQCSPCEQLADLVCAIPGLLRLWHRRARGRADLMRLGPRDLRDIGVTPSEAARECGKPFWQA
jgi:uncharacterized protein YjiS (DUF1127 family)